MNSALNPVVAAKTNQFISSIDQHCLALAKPISSISFRTPLPLPSLSSIKPSSTSSPSSFSATPISKPFISLIPFSLKLPLVSTITATALLFSGFFFNPKLAISCPVSPPPTVDTSALPEDETAEPLEEESLSNPSDVEILKISLENHIKNRELVDALTTIEKLSELEPDETEWYFLKSHLHVHKKELELAKLGFKKVLSMDPYHIDAYRGLLTVAAEDDSVEEMKEVEKKIEEGINMCKEENKESELRDFKLLLAQIWVIEHKYDDALNVYRELVDAEPGDFRPYLCQAMMYAMLSKKDEAEKYFDKYRKLVPQEHPNARFEFMMAA